MLENLCSECGRPKTVAVRPDETEITADTGVTCEESGMAVGLSFFHYIEQSNELILS